MAQCDNTHFGLHTFGSASTGASVSCLGRLPLSLLLQLMLLGVIAVRASCAVSRLDWLLNILREIIPLLTISKNIPENISILRNDQYVCNRELC